MFDFASLEPHIRAILSAPGVDLTTVSAKRVRRELAGRDAQLTPDFIKDHKAEIDEVIGRVFEQVNSPGPESDAEESRPARNRKHSPEDEDAGQTGEEEEDEEEKPKPRKKKASSSTLTDAELARKLSGEINGRSRRTKARGNPSPRKQKKSAATVDSEDEDGEEGGKKKKKRAGGGGAKGGFAKEFALSEPLSTVLNESKLSRPQVVKQLWVYIKANELQNPNNKREIVCDDALRRVFNTDKIDMFKMNKELGSHLYDAANS